LPGFDPAIQLLIVAKTARAAAALRGPELLGQNRSWAEVRAFVAPPLRDRDHSCRIASTRSI
jgi:hypothetical protein